jgi:hypothetical protein
VKAIENKLAIFASENGEWADCRNIPKATYWRGRLGMSLPRLSRYSQGASAFFSASGT